MSSDQESPPNVRRVVTGHDVEKKPKVIWDGPTKNITMKGFATGQSVSTLVWSTDETPADISVGEDIEDMGETRADSQLAPNGSKFVIVDFMPGKVGVVHRTETIDYAIVMSGKMDLDLDGSTTELKAGDVVVQRGTSHAWSNRGKEKARMAFMLTAAKPLGIGQSISTGKQTAQPSGTA